MGPNRFAVTLLITFCVALGVNLGGSLMGSLGAILLQRPPLKTMLELSGELKIWAIAAALGGTFGVIKTFEAGVMGKHFFDLLKQLLIIGSAFLGAHSASLIIMSLGGEG
ncbi:MAG: sporulation protein [Firmicutes bacterium]|nr:sporulation protein [Bacillota bacterium]